MLKRNITSLLTIALLSSTAYGAEVKSGTLPIVSDLNVKLGAFASFEGGTSNQTHRKSKEFKPSSNRNDFALHSDAALHAIISNELDGVEYGGKLILVPTAKMKGDPSYNGSHIFVQTEYGRMELGSPIPVAANMMISAGSIPTKYVNLETDHMKQGNKSAPSFLTGDGCFVGDDIVTSTDEARHSSEPPRTINYYTPKFSMGEDSKVQFGISYTPDTSNTGALSASSKSDGVQKKEIGVDGADKFELDRAVKDAITAAVVLEHKLSENSGLKIAITGEYGKSVGYAKQIFTEEVEDSEGNIKEIESHTKYKLADLRSYNIGGEFNVNEWTYSACYGSHGKSFTTPKLHKTGQNAHYYSAGVSHKYDQFTTDLTYFASEKYKNKLNSLQLKGTYTMAKGFKPYISVTHFVAKGKPEYHSDLKSKKTRGTVFVAGAKLSL